LYWPEIVMPPRTKRAMAFAYGLGNVDVSKGDSSLAVTAPGKPKPGAVIRAIAWVKNPTAGQAVTLELPHGMSIDGSDSATQRVPRGGSDLEQISWPVRIARDAKPGVYTITARSDKAKASVKVPVRRKAEGIFLAQTED
jgi:hypothetical protein